MRNRASLCPERVAELGPEVWNPEGVKILGTLVGSQRFVQEVIEKRLAEEQRLWDAQAAWQTLLQCAGPRCHHVLRTLPPSQSEVYARGHDLGMGRVVSTLLALPGDRHGPQYRIIAHAHGWSWFGMAPAACWASWADAFHMVHQRLPVVADRVVHEISGREDAAGCLSELRGLAIELDRQGFVGEREWHSMRMGVRPQGTFYVEPGVWPHGWQYYASSFSKFSFRKNVVLDQSCAADQDNLRSHSGFGITVSSIFVVDGQPGGGGSTEMCAPEFGWTKNGRIFVESLAAVRARDAPWRRRWSRMIGADRFVGMVGHAGD